MQKFERIIKPTTISEGVEGEIGSTDRMLDNNTNNSFGRISIVPRKIIQLLMSIIIFLLAASLCLVILKYIWNANSFPFRVFNKLFNFDLEANIPALFSTLLLMAASFLLLFIYKTRPSKTNYWLFLSLLFTFLAIDEGVQIHEKFNQLKPEIEVLKDTNLRYVWVFPYSILLIVLFIFLKKFIFSLPRRTYKLMIISAVIFVGGAVGVEMIHDFFKVQYGGNENMYLEFLICLEEVGEMTGTTIFIFALLDYIAPRNSPIYFGTTSD